MVKISTWDDDSPSEDKGTYRDYYCQNCADKQRFRTENAGDTLRVVCWNCTSTLQRFETEEPDDPPNRVYPRG